LQYDFPFKIPILFVEQSGEKTGHQDMEQADQHEIDTAVSRNGQDIIVYICIIQFKWLEKQDKQEQAQGYSKAYPEKIPQGIIKGIRFVKEFEHVSALLVFKNKENVPEIINLVSRFHRS
jgi:hypothetical protein